MYTFNGGISAPPLLSVEAGEGGGGGGGVGSCAGNIPRTPEILNSLIAMTNPLDSYSYSNGQTQVRMNVGNHLQN